MQILTRNIMTDVFLLVLYSCYHRIKTNPELELNTSDLGYDRCLDI